jgi:glycosyltransferase involved in cell wall biosynthesis
MKWLFLGPSLLSGIGQVTARYARLMRAAGHEAEYVVIGDMPKSRDYDKCLAFVLPLPEYTEKCTKYSFFCKTPILRMTICETETVHPAYGLLMNQDPILVASEFCKKVFEKQFPNNCFKVVHLWADPAPLPKEPLDIPGVPPGAYVFYTIGNISDFRKNIRMLMEAFVRCNFTPGTAWLLFKATTRAPLEVKFPHLTVVQGLISDGQMEAVHEAGHCYVNCSHSEGVGMGAVEAALRNKPVIITDYGGLKEYVQTPYVVGTTPCKVGQDDFLFTKDMEWGRPDVNQLITHMKHAYENRVYFAPNAFTVGLMAGVVEELESQ